MNRTLFTTSKLNYVAVFCIACSFLSGCGRGVNTATVEGRPGLDSVARIIESAPGSGRLPSQQIVNSAWAQPHRNGLHLTEHLAFGADPKEIWSQRLSGRMQRGRVASMEALVSDEVVYHLSWDMQLHALDLSSGEQFWRTDLSIARERDAFGGGIALDKDILYATTGQGNAHAIDPLSGSIKWTVDLEVPSRAGPLIVDDLIYATDILGQVTALGASGEVHWKLAAPQSLTGVMAANTPAGDDQAIYIARPDGVLVAVLPNGQEAWRYDMNLLGTTGRLNDSISDVRALPVLDGNAIIASSWADRTVALNRGTGQVLWDIPIGGAATPAVTNEYFFMITKDGILRGFDRRSGLQIWSTVLGGKAHDSQAQNLGWFGPITAGGRLVVGSNSGELIFADPVNGEIISRIDIGSAIIAPLSLANETLLVSTQDGRLRAFR